MGYKITSFQNVSSFSGEVPTIKIDSDHPEWNEIYSNWLSGKNPTDSPEWKKGVIANTEEIK